MRLKIPKPIERKIKSFRQIYLIRDVTSFNDVDISAYENSGKGIKDFGDKYLYARKWKVV